MSKMWKILQEEHPYESYRYGEHKGMKSKEEEAYCEGYEDGYQEAMEMVSERGHMGFRGEGGYSRGGSSRGGSSYSSRMGYRDEEREREEMMMGERRRRRSNGQYY